jgi:hypothetical protein
MRWDELGWDNYGPAHLADVRAGVDAAGNIVAFEYEGWHHGWSTAETSQELALGGPVQPPVSGRARLVNKETLSAVYAMPNVRLVNHHVPGLDGYLKGGNPTCARRWIYRFPSHRSRRSMSWPTLCTWTRWHSAAAT